MVENKYDFDKFIRKVEDVAKKEGISQEEVIRRAVEFGTRVSSLSNEEISDSPDKE